MLGWRMHRGRGSDCSEALSGQKTDLRTINLEGEAVSGWGEVAVGLLTWKSDAPCIGEGQQGYAGRASQCVSAAGPTPPRLSGDLEDKWEDTHASCWSQEQSSCFRSSDQQKEKDSIKNTRAGFIQPLSSELLTSFIRLINPKTICFAHFKVTFVMLNWLVILLTNVRKYQKSDSAPHEGKTVKLNRNISLSKVFCHFKEFQPTALQWFDYHSTS